MLNLIHLVNRRKIQRHNVPTIKHRVAEFVALVVVFDYRSSERRSFRQAQTFDETARHDVSHDNFKLNHVQTFNNHFARTDCVDKVTFNPASLELFEKERADFVVDDALILNGAVFGSVAGCGVVLEVNEQFVGIVGLVNDFRLALIKHVAFNHGQCLLLCKNKN